MDDYISTGSDFDSEVKYFLIDSDSETESCNHNITFYKVSRTAKTTILVLGSEYVNNSLHRAVFSTKIIACREFTFQLSIG